MERCKCKHPKLAHLYEQRIGTDGQAVYLCECCYCGCQHYEAAESLSLSPRQAQIVRAWAEDKTNGAIARELGISERTVSNHGRNIKKKLGCSTRAGVVYRAISAGLLAVI